MVKNGVQKNIWFSKDVAEDLQRQADKMDMPFSSFVKFKIFGDHKNGKK